MIVPVTANLQDKFTLHCTRSNFCYTSPRGIQIIQEDGPPGTSADDDVVEVCINEVNLTWSF